MVALHYASWGLKADREIHVQSSMLPSILRQAGRDHSSKRCDAKHGGALQYEYTAENLSRAEREIVLAASSTHNAGQGFWYIGRH